jgi:transcription-repair coupling factor (superfamily II helicase)
VLRELQRNGQCFFVHNRVETIVNATERVRKIVPEARLAFAHGQMSEVELERIMLRFLQREIDVLVCTTIIESGLDIPNANTIIIDRADMFGLAQLYQLRGRVGRSNRQAYAYFVVPEIRKLGGDAQKRLKVLQSLDDLGMGFNLAIHDLEIRGAGNLLGKQQSGNVVAVGFDLYTKILKEAVLNLKGKDLPFEEEIDPEVKLGLAAFIPDHYIPDIAERLVLYQRLAALREATETDVLAEEIEDRFGPLPQEVMIYLELMRFRSMLRRFGVEKAECAAGTLVLFFSARAPIDPGKIYYLVKSEPERYRFSKSMSLTVKAFPKLYSSPAELYEPTLGVLQKIAAEPAA